MSAAAMTVSFRTPVLAWSVSPDDARRFARVRNVLLGVEPAGVRRACRGCR